MVVDVSMFVMGVGNAAKGPACALEQPAAPRHGSDQLFHPHTVSRTNRHIPIR
jgi:hypothetical protein